ncbi:hypothetical protein [Kitasatospora sp. NPDC056531]|uniref:hypothetical protein n=1 Tax=Kitasatospora sp. NPDC056531 TaxID=3345856 RepID=UPI0036997D0A
MIRRFRPSPSQLCYVAGAYGLFLAVLGGLPASTVLGCLIGTVVGREPLGDLWFLSTHRLFGGRLFCASYGKGPTLWRGVIAGVPVELRLWPTKGGYLPWAMLRVRAQRLRLLLCAAALLGLHAGLGAWLATSCTGPAQGVGFGLLFSFVVVTLVAGATASNSLWAVFALLFRPWALVNDFWSPTAVAAERLLVRSRIAEAHALLDESALAPVERVTAAAVALAQGRYRDARRLAEQVPSSQSQIAQLIIGMAVVGRTDREGTTPDRVSELKAALRPFFLDDRTLLRRFLPAADLARFQGDPEAAVRAARRRRFDHHFTLWPALASCSLAAALIAAGRADEARKALVQAREECPELARIADVERLLEPRPAEL